MNDTKPLNLTEARRFPREMLREACDHCVGEALEKWGNDDPRTLAVLSQRGSVRVYNLLVPGVGTIQHALHVACAEMLRS